MLAIGWTKGNRARVLLAITWTTVVSGCAASVPLAPKVTEQASKTFQPAPGRANLYVYRPSQFKLSAVTVSVKVNGQSFGMLGVGTYLHASVTPGRYTLASVSEQEVPVVVSAEAGRNYFLEQQVAFGSTMAQTALVLVDEAKGRQAVESSEMAASQSVAEPVSPPPGCTKDADCKGDRICVANSCTAPTPTP